jgi:hypothetical protein
VRRFAGSDNARSGADHLAEKYPGDARRMVPFTDRRFYCGNRVHQHRQTWRGAEQEPMCWQTGARLSRQQSAIPARPLKSDAF